MTATTWFVDKYRAQAERLGVQQTARNLRKQGVPLEVALEVLVPREVNPAQNVGMSGAYLNYPNFVENMKWYTTGVSQ